MTPADILTSLFPAGHDVTTSGALLRGTAHLDGGGVVHVLGIVDGAFPGVDEAVEIAGDVLAIAARDDASPILFLLDSGSQRMSRRDELLGLSETLAHLAKALHHATNSGHRTIALLYGGTAAGAFIATALACDTLVALPGAHPAVMDLPSMARVTKLPLAVLEAKAETTPVFAPGLDNIVATGGIAAVWDPDQPLAGSFAALLAAPPAGDTRAALGATRGGRPKAAAIAAEVERLALAHG
jgi:malonate decarboxylase gamma subunit